MLRYKGTDDCFFLDVLLVILHNSAKPRTAVLGLAGYEQKQSTKIAPQIAHGKCKMCETKPFLFLYSNIQFNGNMNNTVIFFNRQNGSVLIYQSLQASSKCVA